MAGRTFEDIQGVQLHIYADELAKLYGLLKSQTRTLLEAEGRFRTLGTRAATLAQVLSAAHMYYQMMLKGALSVKERRLVAERVSQLLERAVLIVRDYERENGGDAGNDMGLAALFRQELYRMASRYGWDVRVETEMVSPSTLTETAAYLIVQEALQGAAMNPHTRQVTLTLKAAGDRLVTQVIMRRESPGSEEHPALDATKVFLARLSARLAGGDCQWRTSRSPSGGAVVEMDLVLPLGSAQPRLESPEPVTKGVAD